MQEIEPIGFKLLERLDKELNTFKLYLLTKINRYIKGFLSQYTKLNKAKYNQFCNQKV